MRRLIVKRDVRTVRGIAAILCTAAIGFGAGCGGRDDLGRVSGEVTLDGKPVENAFLEFVPQEGRGNTAWGRTDASGNYRVMFSENVYGATLGKNMVRITTRDVYVGENGREAWRREQVPPRYNTRSELFVTVEAGQNVCNFALESNGEKNVPSNAPR